MALNWNWDKKIGELEYRNYDGVLQKISIYEGNALMIFIHEWESKYAMYTFFFDKAHLKNIAKECPELFEEWESITLWEINKDLIWACEQMFKCGVNIHFVRRENNNG
jgi:hypothetical protein